jgi:DNA-binding NarL/FixJ family response regulator
MERVLLVDDHPLFRQALRTVIKAAKPQLTITEAGTLEGARAMLGEADHFALVLLDLKLPDSEGFSGLLQLRGEFPAIPIAIISTTEDATAIGRAIALGAAGYIPKSSSRAQITQALDALLAGEIWSPVSNATEQVPPLVRSVASLSPAQLRILMGLRRGMRNKEIAFEMKVSEVTVKCYMTTMFRKLGVTNRTQALIVAQNLLIETTPAP